MEFSVILPVYKNECSLVELYERITQQLGEREFEVIFVHDASPDGSLLLLRDLEKKHPPIQVIDLLTNQGQQKAILKGMEKCRGQKILVLDADLQDKPELFLPLQQLYQKTGDAVFVARQGQYQAWSRMLTSRITKGTVQLLTGLSYQAGSYYLIDDWVLKRILQLARHCPYPYLSIMAARAARKIHYLPAKREISDSPSAYTFAKRLKAAYRALYCAFYCVLTRLEH